MTQIKSTFRINFFYFQLYELKVVLQSKMDPFSQISISSILRSVINQFPKILQIIDQHFQICLIS